MLDLQKYLKKAETDPDFRKKLLQDANQAIKDEFSDELPYKVTCRENLIFEVEAMESLSDADTSSVAGGSPSPNNTLIPFDEHLFSAYNPAIFNVKWRQPSPVPGSKGSISYTEVIEPAPDPLSFPNKLGARHKFDLVRGPDGNIYIIQ